MKQYTYENLLKIISNPESKYIVQKFIRDDVFVAPEYRQDKFIENIGKLYWYVQSKEEKSDEDEKIVTFCKDCYKNYHEHQYSF